MEMEEDLRCSKPKKNNVSSSELPDVIIQHIQSFLRTKEAARTIILSKSWLRAWSIRPLLAFDIDDFSYQNSYTLINLIDKTLESYVEQGINIFKISLRMNPIQERWFQLVRQCNVIELHLCSNPRWETSFWQEIFMTQLLQVLKVVNPKCKLILSHSDIKCRNVNTLNLGWVKIDYVSFLTIMSYCPLIKELLLRQCDFANCFNSGGFVGEFASLKMLTLISTRINDEGLQTILSKTTKLEDLNIIDCYCLIGPINLSIASLTRAKIVKHPGNILIRIDAPNLRQLKYSFYCYCTTPFPITTPATKGEINIDIFYRDRDIDASWFHGLGEFLSKFEKSNVRFKLDYDYPLADLRCNFEELRATPLPHRHQVESLKINTLVPCLPLLYAFFTIWHPKIVLLGRRYAISELESLPKLWKDLSYRGNLACCKEDQNKCWRHYLKDAKHYYEVGKEQKPLDMYELETWTWKWEVINFALEWESSD